MATIYKEPPSADAVLRLMAEWVARQMGVKVTVHIDGSAGESTAIFDGRRPSIDVCTDPDNCRRCKAPAWDKKNHEHAGLKA